jgi:hypothetical protein
VLAFLLGELCACTQKHTRKSQNERSELAFCFGAPP